MIARLNKRLDDRRDSGFTLIELLIVIVILGVLAAIVVFAIGSTRGDSVASSCKTNFKGVELSVEAVKTKTGSYPALSTAAGVVNPPTTDAQAQALYVNVLSPASGALLKQYPWSDDYRLIYTPIAAVAATATTPAVPATYKLVVKDKAGADVGAPATAGGAATEAISAAGCDRL